MRKHAVTFLVNSIILVGAWSGLMVMNQMANTEAVARESVYHAEQKAAATVMVMTQITQAKAGFKHCTGADKPFLTDHILIIGSKIGVGEYATGVVYEVTMAQALDTGSPHYVLAYCE